MKKTALIVSILATMSGCASIGSSEYGCSGLPEGVRCTPSRELYSSTHAGNIPVGSSHEINEDARDPRDKHRKSKHSDQVAEVTRTDPVVDTWVAPQLPDRPVPIRTPAKVMRIWVAPWEESDTGALHTVGYIYTEVEQRRWTIGKPESAASRPGRVFKPLESSGNNQSREN